MKGFKNQGEFVKVLNKKNKHSNSLQTFINPSNLNSGIPEFNK